MIELVIVLAVAVVLTGLMLPAMSRVRENLHRVICSSNLRQLGMSVLSYAGDSNERLPYTVLLGDLHYQPQELMAVYLGGDPAGWDGLGLLYSENYCKAPGVFYCPSHTGNHSSEQYPIELWQDPGSDPIYSNYHYAGHLEWGDNARRRSIDDALLVIATDGLRTTRDFNHVTGMNVLSGDGSVIWRDDQQAIYARLPDDIIEDPELAAATFGDLWQDIEDLTHRR